MKEKPILNRYARQTILPEIGEDGQARITAAKILCIGAGGLGCPALLYLAAAGIGHIGIIDHDNVDETNLHRQTLFTMDDIGKNKAKIAKTRLAALNPDITLTAIPEKLTAANAETLFKQYDLVIDATDNFTAKFLINDAALKTEKPFIYASVLGFEGQISTFIPGQNRPCYRCLFPRPPTENLKNCAQAGILGAAAGIIGSAQALEALKLLLGQPVLSGKLWTLDLKTMDNKILTMPRNPACPACSNPTEITLMNDINEITPATARNRPAALMIDVREADEWAEGHIDNALHIPLSALMEGHIPDLPQNAEIILYCRSGQRSLTAAQILMARGYTNLCSLSGGIQSWRTAA